MTNSKLNYIVEYAKTMNDDSLIEGIIHVCERKRTVYTANLPEWIKNLIISSITANADFKEKLNSELMSVRESHLEYNVVNKNSAMMDKDLIAESVC